MTILQHIIAGLMLFVGTISMVVIIWAGLTRCRKCGGWCVDEHDCKQRRKEMRMW